MIWIKNICIALDQLCNTLCLGWPDETLSSRAWRWHVGNDRHWPYYVIEVLFCFEKNHCQTSFESERLGRQLPPELRPCV